MDEVNHIKNNLISRCLNYCQKNKMFIAILTVVFFSTCLSIIYTPFAYVATISLIIGACFLDLTKIIILMVHGCFNFNGLLDIQIFPSFDLSTNSVIFGSLTLIVFIKYLNFIFKKKQKINWIFAILLLLFFIYILFPVYQLKFNMLWICCFVVGLYCVFEMRKDLNFKEIIYCITIGLFIASITSIFLRLNSEKSSSLGVFYDYDVLKFQALFYNPNFLGIYCIIIFSALLLLQAKEWSNWRLVLITLVYGIGYATISRSFLICSAIGLVVFCLFMLIKYKKKGLLQLIHFAICIILCFVVLFPYTKIYYQRFEDMISKHINTTVYEEPAEDEDSNLDEGIQNEEVELDDAKYDNPSREVLFKLYWEDYTSSLTTILFGRGVCATHKVNMASHNSYIGMLWNLGIIGSMLFIGIILYMLIKMRMKWASCLLLLMPFLVLGVVETLFFTKWFWLLFVLLILGDECLND